MASFKIYTTILVAGMLITGSLNTLTKKAQNQSSAPGLNFSLKMDSKLRLQLFLKPNYSRDL